MTFKNTGDDEHAKLIEQVREVTHCSMDTAKTALFDCDNDLENAITYIFENNDKIDQWQTSWSAKHKQSKTPSNQQSQGDNRMNQENRRGKERGRRSAIESRQDRSNVASAVDSSKDRKQVTNKVSQKSQNFAHQQNKPKDPPAQVIESEESQTQDHNPHVEAWNGESIKIVNSDSAIAMESCLEPAQNLESIAKIPITNGHRHPKLIEGIITKQAVSKKPPVATVIDIPNPVTIASVALDKRNYDIRPQKFTFGDEEARKIATSWILQSSRQGCFLVASKSPTKSESVHKGPTVTQERPTGITTEHIVSMLNVKGPQSNQSRTYSSQIVNSKKLPEDSKQSAYPTISKPSNHSHESLNNGTRQMHGSNNLKPNSFGNFQSSKAEFSKMSIQDNTSKVENNPSNVTSVQVMPTNATTTAMPVQPLGTAAIQQHGINAQYTQQPNASFIGAYGNPPQTTHHQMYQNQSGGLQTYPVTTFGQTSHQTTPSSVEQAFLQYNYRQMMPQSRLYVDGGRPHAQGSQGQTNPHAIHPHTSAGPTHVLDTTIPQYFNQLVYLTNGFHSPQQPSSEGVIPASSGHIKTGVSNPGQQATASNQNSGNNYHHQHDIAGLDSAKYHHSNKQVNYKSGTNQGNFGSSEASSSNTLGAPKLDAGQAIYGNFPSANTYMAHYGANVMQQILPGHGTSGPRN